MDIFKQKRYLIILIVLLVIFNLATLLMIWLNRPPAERFQKERIRPGQEISHIKKLLKEELGFDETQTNLYLKMQSEQREKVLKLQNEIQLIKKQMFDEVLEDNPRPTLSDSLLTLTQEKMVELEKLTFNYFLDLKKLCKPEQQDKLKISDWRIFSPESTDRMKNDGPPPSLPR